MQNHNARLLAITAGTLVLVAVFVAWRAQTFHYCVGSGERERKSRFADLSETCSADEQPMAWRELWQVEGMRSKVKMLGRTTAEAFGLN
jgi:F0F1-type ATP synthase beta subunit